MKPKNKDYNNKNKDYDHKYTNKSDGKTFYGYDDENETTWYDKDGNLDSVTSRYHNNKDDKLQYQIGHFTKIFRRHI